MKHNSGCLNPNLEKIVDLVKLPFFFHGRRWDFQGISEVYNPITTWKICFCCCQWVVACPSFEWLLGRKISRGKWWWWWWWWLDETLGTWWSSYFPVKNKRMLTQDFQEIVRKSPFLGVSQGFFSPKDMVFISPKYEGTTGIRVPNLKPRFLIHCILGRIQGMEIFPRCHGNNSPFTPQNCPKQGPFQKELSFSKYFAADMFV